MTDRALIDGSVPHSPGTGLSVFRHRAYWIIGFGVVLLALGVLAFSSVFAATVATVYFVGISMIAAGVAEIVMGLQMKSWSRFFFWIILGIIYTVSGVFAFTNPLLAAGVLTLVLGASLVATGLLRMFLAYQIKTGSAWLWVVVSGAITTLLGGMILAHWPWSSLYVLGVFLSIDLVFAGFGWISLGLALSRTNPAK